MGLSASLAGDDLCPPAIRAEYILWLKRGTTVSANSPKMELLFLFGLR
jgi:hypothetical protein